MGSGSGSIHLGRNEVHATPELAYIHTHTRARGSKQSKTSLIDMSVAINFPRPGSICMYIFLSSLFTQLHTACIAAQNGTGNSQPASRRSTLTGHEKSQWFKPKQLGVCFRSCRSGQNHGLGAAVVEHETRTTQPSCRGLGPGGMA